MITKHINTTVHKWIFTSIQDMKSSLECSLTNGDLLAVDIANAIDAARELKEITRIKILQSYFHKLTGRKYA